MKLYKNFLIFSILMLTSILCITLVSAESILLSHTTPNDAQAGTTYTTYAYAQGFNLTTTNYVSKIGVIGFRTGSPGTCFLSLRAGDEPTGSDLAFATKDLNGIATTPGEMVNFTFGTSYQVLADTNYSFFIGCPDATTGTDIFTNRLDGTASYDGGHKWYTANNGTTWSVGAEDLLFEIFGGEAAASITNATYYIWDSTGTVFNNSVIVLITGSSNSTDRYIDNFTLGSYEWNSYACHGNAILCLSWKCNLE